MNKRAILGTYAPVFLYAAFLATVAPLALRLYTLPVRPGGGVFPPFGPNGMPQGGPPLLVAGPIVLLLSSLLGLWFSVEITRDYPLGSTMRAAWMLIAGSCVAGLAAGTFELVARMLRGWAMVGLRQGPAQLQMALLLAGLLTMWRAFSSFRMGSLRPVHIAAMMAILAMIPLVYSHVEDLPDSRSPIPAVRLMQALGPLLLFACALIGVILQRISQQVGGGEMTSSLRCLVAFLLLKPIAFILRLYFVGHNPALGALLIGIANSTNWLFVLGIFYRWRLTQRAINAAGQFDRRS